jgi:hypothetical protein
MVRTRRAPRLGRGRPVTLLDLSDDGLRRALAHVPLDSHAACKTTCRRLRDLGGGAVYRRERADSGCEETALLVTGGTSRARGAWSEATFVLGADGAWATRRSVNANPAPGRGRACSGDAGCAAVVGDELLLVGPVVRFGLPSDSFMAYDVRRDAWRDSYAHARVSRRNRVACPPMALGRRFAACGCVAGDLVVCGGETDQAAVVGGDGDAPGCAMAVTGRCDAFSPASREWVEGALPDMPLGVAHAAYGVVRGRLLVAGGVYTAGLRDGLEGESNLLQTFDPATGAWTAEPIDLPADDAFGPFPGTRRGCAVGGDALVVVCGGAREHRLVDDDDAPGGHRFEVVEAPPRTYAYAAGDGAWTELPPLPAGQQKGDSTSLQRECSARARSGNITHASRALREMIARPKMSRNEWKMTERGAFEVGHVAPFCCPGCRSSARASRPRSTAATST